MSKRISNINYEEVLFMKPHQTVERTEFGRVFVYLKCESIGY